MIRILIILMLLVHSSRQMAAMTCNQQDSLQLVELYNATDGANWSSPWDLSQPVSTWEGIILSVSGRVTEINLFNLGLSGSIPNLNLPYLTRLYLSANPLTGSIPAFDLPQLTSLIINGTPLSGSIPNFNLPNLTELQLVSNQFSGNIPNFNLPNLTEINLAGNALTGNIPNFDLLALVRMRLNYNQLSGSIPDFNLPNLVEISLNDNALSGSIPNFNLPNLQYLGLSYNQLSGSIPDLNLPKLYGLGLNNNRLTGSTPNLNLPELLFMSMSNNLLTFDCIEGLIGAPSFYYSPQALIPIHISNNILSVNAGGTLSKNTYRWYKVGGGDIGTHTGDSTQVITSPGSYFCNVSNSSVPNLTLSSDLFIVLTTDVAEINEETAGFRILPNPASDFITVDFHPHDESATIISVVDAGGKTIFSEQFSDGNIDVRHLRTGVYAVKITTDKGDTYISRFVKK